MKKSIKSNALVVALLSGWALSAFAAETGKISPYLFGQNLWLTEGAEGRPGYIQSTLWPKVKDSQVKVIRIGGNAYDSHLPDFDTLTLWVKSIKAIGAEPMMQVSKVKSPEDAAALVRYFNKTSGLYIKYWCVGNEPFLLQHYTMEAVSKYIKERATAMKAVDPEIKIFAPDEAAYLPDFYKALLLDDKLSVAGRDVNGHWYIDGVSFHNYPNGKDYNRSDVIFYSVTKMRGMIQDLLADIARADAKYQRFGDDRLLWGLTEFNITYANPDDLSVTGFAVPSFINGQFWAEVFAMGMEYGAFTMTAWCIQESDRPSTYFGYIGGPPDFWPHSTYYHTQMLAENMKGEYVKMGADNPYVKVFGSRSDEGSTVVLLNQDSAKTFAFDLGRLNQPAAEGKLAIKAAAPIKTTFAGSIEPNSTLVLVFNRKGELQKELLYNLELAAKNQAPKRVR